MTARRPLLPILALGLVAALVALSFAGRAGAGEDDAVTAAWELLAKGRSQEALAAFRALADKPGGSEDARVMAGLGQSLVAVGDPSAALQPLGVAAKKRGTAEDHAALAEALVAVAAERAEAPFARGVGIVAYLHDAITEATAGEKSPGADAVAARLRWAKGRAYWNLSDFKAAREALSHPSLAAHAEARDLLARACYALGDYPAAAEVWKALGNRHAAATAWAAAKDPRAMETYRALVLEAAADRALQEEAVLAAVYAGDVASHETFLAALGDEAGRNPRDRFEAYRARGLLFEHAKRFADAAASYHKALALPGMEEASVRTSLARALVNAGPDSPEGLAEATALLKQVLAENALDATARELLRWIGVNDVAAATKEWPGRSRLDRALEAFKALAESAPEDSAAWSEYGLTLRTAGDLEGSIKAYDRAVAVNPLDAVVANDRGLAVLATGDTAAAIAAFEAASRVDPRDTSPRQNVARLHWLLGRDDEAEAHLAAAVKSARETGGKPLLYRFLLDRVWRSRVRPEVR